jgi:hypothetical protein
VNYLRLGAANGSGGGYYLPGAYAANANVTSVWYCGSHPDDVDLLGIAMFRRADFAPISAQPTRSGDMVPYLQNPLTGGAGRWIFEVGPAGAFGWVYNSTNGNVNGCGNMWTNFVSRQFYDFAGAVTQANYNVYQFGFRPTARTLQRLFGKTSASTVTVDILEATTNSAWATYTTNVSLILSTSGAQTTTFGDGTIAANALAGWKFRQRGATCTNATWTLQYMGE